MSDDLPLFEQVEELSRQLGRTKHILISECWGDAARTTQFHAGNSVHEDLNELEAEKEVAEMIYNEMLDNPSVLRIISMAASAYEIRIGQEVAKMAIHN